MKDLRHGFITTTSTCLMALALGMHLPLVAWADDASSSSTSSSPSSPEHTMLYGSANVYAAAMQKLSKRQRLTAEEYRSLGIGTAGFEANQTFFQNTAKVIKVYRDSPADKAGVRVGDKMLMTEANPAEAMERANPTQPLFQIKFKKVGVPVEITLLRHKEPVKMTLITMNIEDIEEPEIRKMFEKMVSELDYPQDGTFTGPSIHTLTPTQ